MDKYAKFKQSFEEAVKWFKRIDKKEVIRVISHLDADGISACAVMLNALDNENRRYSISIIRQLGDENLHEYSREEYKHFIFTDLGSGKISSMGSILKDKSILILDHHKPEKAIAQNVTHINPNLFGIEGGTEISGAGVAYFFSRKLNSKNKVLAHLGIIGAIGDIQDENGFSSLNLEILDDAVKAKKLEVIENGLKFFGKQTRPLFRILQYTDNPYIPDISGSMGGAILFLKHVVGIDDKRVERVKIRDLNKEQMERLRAGIIMKRSKEEDPEDIFSNSYLLVEEKEGSPLKDVKEFSTLLNACGRLERASLGIGVCLGDKKSKESAMKSMKNYRREIAISLDWYHSNKNSNNIFNGNKFTIINAKDNILASVAGTMASILSKSNEFEDGHYILSMAQMLDDNTKASMRVAGRNIAEEVDLRVIIQKIAEEVDGEAGGHKHAAGALFATEYEDKFVDIAKQVLTKYSIEEKIVES
ncbi:DHH family phosphoesterase [Candidatus Woesearchaeota archaeon]|nr:DHH family phosphoesterase [Candidatus Woesearchaeota archaeon]